ncbi:MAG: phosphoglycerate kinase [Candidatus Puniceispirillum sp.]|nr:phosphoglycerate kinase [Candidatus Pelagibacter sp.]MBA4283393.1 phosphoglycerate kinase [Candidatus Puniceispirillum sp.]
MHLKHIKNLGLSDLENKYILVRVDWNVPMNAELISDSTRITSSIQTIEHLVQHKAKVLILTHFGRPQCAREQYKNTQQYDLFAFEEEYSLKHLKAEIEKNLKHPLLFIDNLLDPETQNSLLKMKAGDIALCENVRFYGGEEHNDEKLAQTLSELGDIFVNDAFACSHRSHVTTVGLSKYLPSYAGFNVANEINYLEKITQSPTRPLWAIVGGSKISTKIDILKSLIQKVDGVIITGAMAHTFMKAKSLSVGNSLWEPNHIETALDILKQSPCEIILPVDGYGGETLSEPPQLFSAHTIPENKCFFDIGPESFKLFEAKLKNAKTILWNGPSGVFEQSPYDWGSMQIAKLCAQLTSTHGVITLAGGGDTLSALSQTQQYFGIDYSKQFSFLSTGGGSFLEWIEKGILPGIKPLYK